jgi:hypothetical protein
MPHIAVSASRALLLTAVLDPRYPVVELDVGGDAGPALDRNTEFTCGRTL